MTLKGRGLRALRVRSEVKLIDVAAAVGIPASKLSGIEHGEKPLAADMAARIEAAIKELREIEERRRATRGRFTKAPEPAEVPA